VTASSTKPGTPVSSVNVPLTPTRWLCLRRGEHPFRDLQEVAAEVPDEHGVLGGDREAVRRPAHQNERHVTDQRPTEK
jgi:hypothetical protein